MAWKAYFPWQREFNSYQKSTLFHENGRVFLPAHLNSYFSNSLAYLNSSSPALAPVPAPEQTLTCPLLETHWGRHRFLGLTSTEASLHFRCLPLQSGVAHPSICTGQRTAPDETRFMLLLLHPGFSSWCWLSGAQSPSPQDTASILVSVSCCNEFLVSPALFPHPVTSLSPTLLTLCFVTLRFFWQTLALVTIVTAVLTHMLLPLSWQVSDLQISPFQAEISQAWTETRVVFAVAIFVARKISV